MEVTPLQSLIGTGTKLWLDSVDPDLVQKARAQGATGATSNPIIIAALLKSGRWDADIRALAASGQTAEEIAWTMTDRLVTMAEEVFRPVFDKTKGNDGYVSFELDPLLEDAACPLSTEERVVQYVELGKKWAKDHPNRMIKVPATPAGLGALEDLAAAGINLNVTLLFSLDQYTKARDAVLRGYQRSPRDSFKSVYSIFVSRLDVYSQKAVPALGDAQGWVGVVNAKRIWSENRSFWRSQGLAIDQEMIFASTGTKDPKDPKWKYVEQLSGADIQTNPPETNEALESSGHLVTSHIDYMPEQKILNLIDDHVNMEHLEHTLMSEGLAKFAEPQKELIALIATIATKV